MHPNNSYFLFMTRRFHPLVPSLFLIFLFSGCNSNRQFDSSGLIEKVEKTLPVNADQALQYIDSAFRTLPVGEWEDPLLLRTYELQQQAYAQKNEMDSVLKTGVLLRNVASRLSDSLAIAKSLLLVKGEIALKDQHLLEPYFLPAIQLFHQQNKSYEEGKIEALYGEILVQKNDFNNAMDHMFRSIALLEKVDSIKPLFSIYLNIGTVFSLSNSLPKSHIYYRKALELGKQLNDSLRQSMSYMNIGTSYQTENKLDSSFAAYELAELYLPAKGGELTAIKIKYNKAEIYEARSQFQKAGLMYQEVLDSCNKNNIWEGVALAKRGLARVFSHTGNQNFAIELMRASIKELDSLGLKLEELDHLSELILIYKKFGQFEKALQSSEELKKLSDSLRSVEKQTALEELEIVYESEKKQQDNVKLQNELNARKKVNILLIILLVGLVFLLRVFWQRNRYHRERNQSYQALMQKYRQEKLSREQTRQPIPVPIEEPAPDNEQTQEELLYQKLNDYYRMEKPYLNPRLKVEDVSEYLQVSQKELLNCIRMHRIRNFNTFSNMYRVAEVRRMFEDSNYNQMKLDAIGLAAGFGSKPPFYAAFEEETGMKPGYYRSHLNS